MMTFFVNDDRIYSDIIEKWVLSFRNSNKTPAGIKIVMDGYAEDDNQNVDMNHEFYLVFVHEESPNGIFPPHDDFPFIIHRPDEEVCISCWYDVYQNKVKVIPFEDNNSTELNHSYVLKLINLVNNKWEKDNV